jgi:hypothetical protein
VKSVGENIMDGGSKVLIVPIGAGAIGEIAMGALLLIALLPCLSQRKISMLAWVIITGSIHNHKRSIK